MGVDGERLAAFVAAGVAGLSGSFLFEVFFEVIIEMAGTSASLSEDEDIASFSDSDDKESLSTGVLGELQRPEDARWW